MQNAQKKASKWLTTAGNEQSSGIFVKDSFLRFARVGLCMIGRLQKWRFTPNDNILQANFPPWEPGESKKDDLILGSAPLHHLIQLTCI